MINDRVIERRDRDGRSARSVSEEILLACFVRLTAAGPIIRSGDIGRIVYSQQSIRMFNEFISISMRTVSARARGSDSKMRAGRGTGADVKNTKRREVKSPSMTRN
jgi:hypothetical protein